MPCDQNLIRNGSFENPGAVGGYARLAGGSETITGWRAMGGGVEYQNPRPPSPQGVEGLPADGNQIVNISGDSSILGGITQDIATEPGQRYWLRFRPSPAGVASTAESGLFTYGAGRWRYRCSSATVRAQSGVRSTGGYS
ncbi:MAG: DUF642 domain-containing protein [Pedosphaera sp.]|nr:DUF642 domain-containing protein [Pedosphaera sp.]